MSNKKNSLHISAREFIQLDIENDSRMKEKMFASKQGSESNKKKNALEAESSANIICLLRNFVDYGMLILWSRIIREISPEFTLMWVVFFLNFR